MTYHASMPPVWDGWRALMIALVLVGFLAVVGIAAAVVLLRLVDWMTAMVSHVVEGTWMLSAELLSGGLLLL